MKTPPALRKLFALGLTGVVALASVAAIKKGDTVFSKRADTALLAEPKPLAPPAAKVGFAESLKIEEVQGKWLKVTAPKAAGWIFSGNVAEEKPKHAPAAGLTTVSASATNTVAAARPLAPAAEGFAERHDAAEAKADVEWIDAAAGRVSEEQLVTYLRENRKGEYAP